MSGSWIKNAKRAAKMALGRMPWVWPDIRVPTAYLGTDYGGWCYCPAALNADSIVYDFGIGKDASFPIGLIEKHGLTVYAFDPTPEIPEWIASQGFDPRFIFAPLGLAWFDGEIEIRSQSTECVTSQTILGRESLDVPTTGTSIQVRRLDTFMTERGHEGIDLLKMDIEGAEFKVVEDLMASKIRPRQILIETHRYFADGLALEKTTFRLLKDGGYLLYDISLRDMEFSYIHRDVYREVFGK